MEASNSNENSKSGSGATDPIKQRQGIRIENPFTLKVGQVFTGFGIGCGVGIGVGRPINLGAVPVVNQVISATRGATDAFSGVTRHVNGSLRKLGAKNIEAGIGCGVGFGHGFGVGLAIKPSVLNQVQASFMQVMAKMMMKFGMSPNLNFNQGAFPGSLQTGMSMIQQPSNQTPMGIVNASVTPINAPNPIEPPFATRTEKVIDSFLQNPVFKGEETESNNVAGRLRSENSMLQMVLRHQQIIEELMEENQKLRHILVEDLKIPPSKLQASSSSRNTSPCSECFECRRKQRKK